MSRPLVSRIVVMLGFAVAVTACDATGPTTASEPPVVFLRRLGGIAGVSERVVVLQSGALVYECEHDCGPTRTVTCTEGEGPEREAKIERVRAIASSAAFAGLPSRIGEDQCCDRFWYEVGWVRADGGALVVTAFPSTEWPSDLQELVRLLEELLNDASQCDED